MTSIFGLPTHVLVVHAAVVLGPLTAVVALISMMKTSWRSRLDLWLLLATTVVTGSLIVASNSGENLGDIVQKNVDFHLHQSLAETARNLSLLWFVAMVTFVVATRLKPSRPMVGRVLAVVVSVCAVATTVWIIRAGHEGARLQWTGVIPS